MLNAPANRDSGLTDGIFKFACGSMVCSCKAFVGKSTGLRPGLQPKLVNERALVLTNKDT